MLLDPMTTRALEQLVTAGKNVVWSKSLLHCLDIEDGDL